MSGISYHYFVDLYCLYCEQLCSIHQNNGILCISFAFLNPKTACCGYIFCFIMTSEDWKLSADICSNYGKSRSGNNQKRKKDEELIAPSSCCRSKVLYYMQQKQIARTVIVH
jgi:hypothetical protein